MFELVVLLVVVAPPFLAYAARNTAGWWIPGFALLVGGVIPFGLLEDTHGDIGGIGALGNGVLVIMGLALLAYGLLLLAITFATRAALRRRQPRPSLPVATLVAGDVNGP